MNLCHRLTLDADTNNFLATSAKNTGFLETEISGPVLLWRTENEMIQKLDLQHAGAFCDATGQPEIDIAWRWIA